MRFEDCFRRDKMTGQWDSSSRLATDLLAARFLSDTSEFESHAWTSLWPEEEWVGF